MWTVGIVVRHSNYIYGNISSSDIRKQVYWCRVCCDLYDLHGNKEVKTSEPAQPKVTFEEKLREIMREEIEAMIK